MSEYNMSLFQSATYSLYNNISYYTNKIQEILIEITKINETVVNLRRRIIQVELESQQNNIKCIKLQKELDKIKSNKINENL